jgi:homoserine kinase type II
VGTFTALDAGQLGALAAAFGLGPLKASRPIAAGTINSNFAIETDAGRFFLRVNEGKAEADVAWESRLVATLAAAGVPTPPPQPATTGQPYAPLPSASPRSASGASDTAGASPKWVSAFPWRPGVHLAPDEVTVSRAQTFGRALAQLHVAALALPAEWRRASIYDHANLVRRFETISRVGDPVLAHAIDVLGRELEVASKAAPIRAAATQGIIHGDLFRDNVLWDGEAISAILDFEQASGGSLAYDLAVCINDWCWNGAPRIDLATALLAGYQAIRPLAAADREALPYEIRAAAARFTITRITDVYLAEVQNPEKDFRAFLARVEAWQGPSLRALTHSV